MGKKISMDAAAEELGISIRSIRRLISRGDLKAWRVGSGSLIRIDTDDLDKVLNPVVPNGKLGR